MREGIFAALDAVEAATGERKVDDDRLLRRRHAARGRARLHGGDRRRPHRQRDLLHDAGRFHSMRATSRSSSTRSSIQALEEGMQQRGYLEGSRMANAFNMLRPNDLIWPYVINNYLKGQAPFPFDLLYWNSDSDPHAGREPRLLPAQLLPREQARQGRDGARRRPARPQEGEDPDLQPRRQARTTSPLPARSSTARRPSAARSTTSWPAPATSPASSTRSSKPKYQFWTGGPPKGEFEDWVAKASEHPGSWWPYWFALDREAGARSASRPASPAAASSSRSATRRERMC